MYRNDGLARGDERYKDQFKPMSPGKRVVYNEPAVYDSNMAIKRMMTGIYKVRS